MNRIIPSMFAARESRIYIGKKSIIKELLGFQSSFSVGFQTFLASQFNLFYLLLCFIFFPFSLSAESTERTFPSYEEFKMKFTSSEAILLDRNGILLQTIRTDFSKRSYLWLELNQFPSFLVEAILATEDKEFWEHSGVDTLALISSAYSGLRGWGLRGGSTITMQVVAELDPSLGRGGTRRSITQKIRQIQAASALEEVWTKEEILSAYLNTLPLRGENVGIPIATLYFWNTATNSIDKKMSLVIASMIRSPNTKPQLIAQRAFRLSNQLKWNYSQNDLEAFTTSSFHTNGKYKRDHPEARDENYASNLNHNLAFHYANQYAAQKRGVVTSSLDYQYQKHAYESLRNNLASIRNRNVKDGAVLVLDNQTGEVIVYIGGIPEFSSAKYVDAIQSFRQAGSTLKPFLYTLALDKKYITATSILVDSPLDIDVTRGMYRPSNYDNAFQGLVFAKQALASSLNIPAVRLIQMVGVDSFFDTIQKLGFRNLKDSDYYGYSLALGTLDVSLWDLTWAYWTLANSGKNKEGQTIFSNEASYITSDILSNRMNRSLSFGLENSLSTRYWSVVKTGTSQDMRDNWCVGYSEKYTVGVWIGNFSGEPMHNVTGITGAAPIWRDVMDQLQERQNSNPNSVPKGIQQKFQDFYLQGTEPNQDPLLAIQEIQLYNSELSAQIEYPIDGMIVAYDPDIPMEYQKILFQGKGNTQRLKWNLNGINLGSAESPYPWLVQKGKFTLELRTEKNLILQSVSFEVR